MDLFFSTGDDRFLLVPAEKRKRKNWYINFYIIEQSNTYRKNTKNAVNIYSRKENIRIPSIRFCKNKW